MNNKKSEKACKLNIQEVQTAAERLAEDYTEFINYMSSNVIKLAVRTTRLGKSAALCAGEMAGFGPHAGILCGD